MGLSLAGRSDYRSLTEAHARAIAGPLEAAREPEAAQESPTERTELEWSEAVEARKTDILEKMRARGANAADLVWKERQLASEPVEDHIRAIKAEEELQRRGGNSSNQNDSERDSGRARTEPYEDGPQRPLTKEEKRAKILEAGDKFENAEQARQDQNSRGGNEGGREH